MSFSLKKTGTRLSCVEDFRVKTRDCQIFGGCQHAFAKFRLLHEGTWKKEHGKVIKKSQRMSASSSLSSYLLVFQ